MKITKGDAGYIDHKKKQEFIKVLIEFGMVIAVFVTGYITTKTRLNLLTLVAVLGCLPASKAMVGYIMLIPRKSLEKNKIAEIEERGKNVTKAYDMIITSYDHVMPIDSIAIVGDTICGYTENQKIDVPYAEKYLKRMLHNNKFDKVSVKLFQEYEMYLARVEAMNQLAAGKESLDHDYEQKIKEMVLTLSM